MIINFNNYSIQHLYFKILYTFIVLSHLLHSVDTILGTIDLIYG